MTESSPSILPMSPPAADARDTTYLDRIEANLAIAEQTINVAHEIDRAPAGEPTPQISLAVSVVIPVYNERDTIIEIVRRVQAVGIHQEIIIVDDFSMDGTRQILMELVPRTRREADVPRLQPGQGAALRTGFEQAGGDVVLIQDADLEYNPNDLPRMVGMIERGEADVVYGSRFLAHPEQDPLADCTASATGC